MELCRFTSLGSPRNPQKTAIFDPYCTLTKTKCLRRTTSFWLETRRKLPFLARNDARQTEVPPEPLRFHSGDIAVNDWPADKVERRDVASLVPYAKNARTHSAAQVAAIAASIREWG